MRYCANCRRLTAGQPLFCNHCGRSYDSKLCPSRHVNPRTAQVCSACGSRDLSTPQPRLPLLAAPVIWLLSALPGVLLLLVSVMFFLGLAEALVSQRQMVLPHLFLTGLLLGLLWLVYMHLPGFVRSLVRKLFARTARKGPDR